MKHLVIAGTAAATLLAAVSCGGSGSGRSGGPASYLTVSHSKVAFIQWHATANGHLHGTITEGNAGGSAPAETLSVSSVPFTGTMSGSSVRLTFPVLYFLHTSAHGTLSGSTLTLRVPQSDGTIQQATFSKSDEARSNRAIAALRSRIRHVNLLAARQQARERQWTKVQAERGTQSALSALYQDSSLASGGRLAGGVARFAHDIQTARSHLATEKQDAASKDSYCVAAFKAAGDARTVGGDLQSVQGDVVAVMPGISTVRSDVAAVNAHLRHLSKVGLPAPASASDVIANANAGLRHTISVANAYIDQINAIGAQARSIAGHMATRSCSKAQSGSSTPVISHIR